MAPPPHPFPPGWRPKARADVDFRHVGEGWVLFDPAAQRIHVLDLTAALLWSYCDGESDVPALEERVREAFGAAVGDPQVGRTLQGFQDEGLLQAP